MSTHDSTSIPQAFFTVGSPTLTKPSLHGRSNTDSARSQRNKYRQNSPGAGLLDVRGPTVVWRVWWKLLQGCGVQFLAQGPKWRNCVGNGLLWWGRGVVCQQIIDFSRRF